MRVLELLGAAPSFPLVFAALLHDIGKPRTLARTPDRYTFYDHEHIGADIARDICERLKLSNAERDRRPGRDRRRERRQQAMGHSHRTGTRTVRNEERRPLAHAEDCSAHAGDAH